MNYKNLTHATIYKTFLINSPYKYSNRFLGAAYLLAASKDTWQRAKKAIKEKRICFKDIDRNGLTAYGYALLTMAQDIFESTTHINLFDLSDPYLISDKTLDLVVNALLIAREGNEATGVNKHFE